MRITKQTAKRTIKFGSCRIVCAVPETNAVCLLGLLGASASLHRHSGYLDHGGRNEGKDHRLQQLSRIQRLVHRSHGITLSVGHDAVLDRVRVRAFNVGNVVDVSDLAALKSRVLEAWSGAGDVLRLQQVIVRNVAFQRPGLRVLVVSIVHSIHVVLGVIRIRHSCRAVFKAVGRHRDFWSIVAQRPRIK